MWLRLQNLMSSNHNKNNNISMDANILNNFFTSVFQQASNYNARQNHTIPDNSYILNNLFLSPISPNEIIHTFHNHFISNVMALMVYLPIVKM